MEQVELKYNPQFAGARAVASAGAVYTTGVTDRGTQYGASAGSDAYTTGYYYDTDGMSIYVQTTSGVYLYVDLNAPKWSFTENVVNVKTYSQSQAQALINTIIENNKIILNNNLLCARFASKLTSAQREEVRKLQERLQERNSALQAEGLTMNVQTNYPKGYSEFSPYMDKLMAGEGVGVVVATWVLIVIAATCVAAASTAAYFAYKYYAEQSKQDVKFSKELTKTLTTKLTEEEYNQLLKETNGFVTKSRIFASLGSYGKVFLAAGLAIGGVVLYRYIKNKL